MGSPRFTATDDTAMDSVTGLTWQRVVPTEKFTWEEAKEYAKTLKLDGHSDWRLPTIEELFSIIDYSRQNPAIDPVAFPNTPAEFFWSSSPYALSTDDAWGVCFYYGNTDANVGSTYNGRVRCVR